MNGEREIAAPKRKVAAIQGMCACEAVKSTSICTWARGHRFKPQDQQKLKTQAFSEGECFSIHAYFTLKSTFYCNLCNILDLSQPVQMCNKIVSQD